MKQTKYYGMIGVLAAMLFVLSFWSWFRTPDTYSESERRVLAASPKFNTETVLSGSFMSDFESSSLDQFPMRDMFRKIKAIGERYVFHRMDSHDLYLANGYIAKVEYPMSTQMLDHAAGRFQNLYDTYLSGGQGKKRFVIVPDKNYFLGEQTGHLTMDYDVLIDYMKERTEYMEYVDIRDLLSLDDYYRTDTHWRQEKICDVAERIAGAFDMTLQAEYEVRESEAPFYGVYYGQAALPVAPDDLKYLYHEMFDQVTVTSYDKGVPAPKAVYNLAETTGRDPYEMFLGGADALLVIENPNASTDKELIVFRDSFGSSLIPLLIEAYSKITVVDIRYIQSNLLGNFIEFGDQDVLVMYSTLLLNSSLGLR